MGKVIVVNVHCDSGYTYVTDSYYWHKDSGNQLVINGLGLKTGSQVHFSLTEKNGVPVPMFGVEENGVFVVDLPNRILQDVRKRADYEIYAFVYNTSETGGWTEHEIIIPVHIRPSLPYENPTDEDLTAFDRAVELVKGYAEFTQTTAENFESDREQIWQNAEDIEYLKEHGVGGGDSEDYKLPQATETNLGGVKASPKTDNDTVEAKIGEDGKLYVPTYPEKNEITVDSALDKTSTNPIQNKTVAEAVERLSNNKLEKTALPDAINTALTQAKESGAFDGTNGTTPHIGANGNWFIGDEDTGVSATGGTTSAVHYTEQTLTDEQQAQARTNIGAASQSEVNRLSEKIVDKAKLENGVIKFYKSGETDKELFSVDISSIGGSGGLDLNNLTLSVSQVGEYQRLSMSDGTTTKTVDIPITVISDEQVQTAVQTWLNEHPEATTTVSDGSINPNKTTWLRQIFHNIFDASTIADGYYFFSNANAMVTGGGTANYFASDYIPVEGGKEYYFNAGMATRWFDADKVFITDSALTLSVKGKVTAPENASYVRFSVSKGAITADSAQVYEYIGEVWDYDTYRNLYDIRIASENYTEAIVEMVKTEIENGNIDIGDLVPLENIPFRKIYGFEEYHWNIVNPKIVSRSWSGTYWKYETDYIPVKEGDVYYVLHPTVTGYDADYVSQGNIDKPNGVMTIPSGVTFIKLNSGYTSDENYVFRVYKRGYGKNDLFYSSVLDYEACFPMFKNEFVKDGFKSYLGVYPWADKKLCFIGDSFSAPNKWQTNMCNNLKAIHEGNAAVSGGAFADYDGVPKTAYEQAQKLVTNGKNPDVILITLGTNDEGNKIALGEIVSSTSISDFDLTTYTGGMQACLNYLQNNFPSAVIYVGWTPMGGLQKGGTEYIERMKEVALMYGIEYIETRTCGVTTLSAIYADCYENGVNGGHPTDNGQNKIGEYMTRLMSGKK